MSLYFEKSAVAERSGGTPKQRQQMWLEIVNDGDSKEYMAIAEENDPAAEIVKGRPLVTVVNSRLL